MEFRNLTPFHALAYQGVDLTRQEFHAVVMRVAYKLERITPTGGSPYRLARADKSPFAEADQAKPTHQCVPLYGAEAVPLVMADRCEGQPNTSSIIEESDLAPFKPKCDVLVRATAHAPAGRPATCWPVRVRLTNDADRRTRLAELSRRMAGVQANRWLAAKLKSELAKPPEPKVLLDKTLLVYGPRHFHHHLFGWSLSDPEPAAQAPIRWEETFGGASWVETDAGPKLNEVCFTNPLGCGWVEESLLKLAKKGTRYRVQARQELRSFENMREFPAPRIEYPGEPVQKLISNSQPSGLSDPVKMAGAAKAYRHRPAGLGPIGRAWTPRLQKAGTYDDAWLKKDWPYLPKNFNFGYWNSAPEDQQIDWPVPDLLVELLNHAPPAETSQGWLRFRLPVHRALVHLRLPDGALVPVPMWIDTVHIDTEAMRLHLVWRIIFPLTWSIQETEARFEINPDVSLVRFASPEQSPGTPPAVAAAIPVRTWSSL